MKVVTKARKHVKGTIARWIYSSFYVLGLTILYPYVMLGTPSTPSLLIASLFLLVGVIGVQRYEHTLAKTLSYLGKTTLVPGFIGVLLLLFGRATLAAFLPDGITPFVETYIQFMVPKAALLTIVYFVVGLLLWFVGKFR